MLGVRCGAVGQLFFLPSRSRVEIMHTCTTCRQMERIEATWNLQARMCHRLPQNGSGRLPFLGRNPRIGISDGITDLPASSMPSGRFTCEQESCLAFPTAAHPPKARVSEAAPLRSRRYALALVKQKQSRAVLGQSGMHSSRASSILRDKCYKMVMYPKKDFAPGSNQNPPTLSLLLLSLFTSCGTP